MESAWLNIMAMVLMRGFTFVINGFMIRSVTGVRLGTMVRLYLKLDTILFLSTEAFRKACVAKPNDPKKWPSIVNLVWLGLFPVGLTLIVTLNYVWKWVLEPPDEDLEQYLASVDLLAVTIVLRIISEPFFVIGQAYLQVLDCIIQSTPLIVATETMSLNPH